MREDIKDRIEQVKCGKTPKGYQYNKRIGISPIHWKIGKLSDVLKNVQRPVPKPANAYWRLGIRSHAKGTFHELVSDPNTILMKELYLVETNDLVVNITFAWEHAIALAGIEDSGKLVSHRFPTYVFKNGNIPEYFKSVVIQPNFKEMLIDISPGGAGRNRVLNKTDFLKLPCYIPPQNEQQKIATILNQCDKIIELKKQLIEEERKRKKWLIQKLFDSESDTHGIRVDGEWTSASLDQLFEFGPSLTASRADLGDEGVCYLHYGDIHGNNRTFIDMQVECDSFPKLLSTNTDRFLLKHGDVVFVDASEDYDGASKYVVVVNPTDVPLVAGLHTIPAKSKTSTLDINYKKYCFQSGGFKKQVAFYVSGMKIYGLNKENLAKIKISYPPLVEQRAIAKLLISVDTHIDLIAQELSQWKQKEKALMQMLLTGLVRV